MQRVSQDRLCARFDQKPRKSHSILPPAHLVLLAATVAQANFTSRFNSVFGVELP